MMRINLLPYREEKRKAKRQQFYGLLGLVAVLGVLIVFAVSYFIDGYLAEQNGRNDFLKKEIAVLDKEVDEIKRLNDQIQALLARKQIIESLQQDRADAVLLLSELTRQTPEGIYLHTLKQEGVKITLGGYAQSNARVSTLMRNIEASAWLERPELTKIEAVTVNNTRLNAFDMSVFIKQASTQEAGKQ